MGASQILADPAFANARQPLAQRFQPESSKRTFVAVVNHFKSKGSGEDDGTDQGKSNPSRVAQAKALTGWVKRPSLMTRFLCLVISMLMPWRIRSAL